MKDCRGMARVFVDERGAAGGLAVLDTRCHMARACSYAYRLCSPSRHAETFTMRTTSIARSPRIAWLVALGAVGWLALTIAAFLILPPLLHPLLPAAELRPLDAEQRIQLQQDQR